MDFLEALEWRYATKRMNGKSLPEDTLERILEATRLAPSSYGLQPYTIKVISDRSLLERIHEDAAPQPQVKECSHLLVFATKTDLDDSTAAKQAYIALGFTLAAAAIERVDASPMEGFNPAAIDHVLRLNEENLSSVVIAALGYRDTAEDRMANVPKVRRPRSQLIQAV